MTRPPTVAALIRSLGYCCPWLFFQLFPSTALAALRLGVDPRSIRREKTRAAAGCEGCRGCCAHRQEEMRRRLAARATPES